MSVNRERPQLCQRCKGAWASGPFKNGMCPRCYREVTEMVAEGLREAFPPPAVPAPTGSETVTPVRLHLNRAQGLLVQMPPITQAYATKLARAGWVHVGGPLTESFWRRPSLLEQESAAH